MKRLHTGSPKHTAQKSNLPPLLEATVNQNTAMTAAINETTSRLRILEDNNTTTKTLLENLSTHLETQQVSIRQQSNDISTLGNAFQGQNKLITALQQTQVQQETTMENMSKVKT